MSSGRSMPPSYRDNSPNGSQITAQAAAGTSSGSKDHRPRRRRGDPQVDEALERARHAIKRFRENRNISISKWEDEAGLGQGTLGKFIRGGAPRPRAGQKRTKPTRDIGLEALLRLAHAQKATVAELIGEGPPTPSAPIDSQLLADILAELESYLQKTGDTLGPTEKVLVTMVLYDASQREGRSKFVMDDWATSVLKLALRKPKNQ
jgi:hypothetical protein